MELKSDAKNEWAFGRLGGDIQLLRFLSSREDSWKKLEIASRPQSAADAQQKERIQRKTSELNTLASKRLSADARSAMGRLRVELMGSPRPKGSLVGGRPVTSGVRTYWCSALVPYLKWRTNSYQWDWLAPWIREREQVEQGSEEPSTLGPNQLRQWWAKALKDANKHIADIESSLVPPKRGLRGRLVQFKYDPQVKEAVYVWRKFRPALLTEKWVMLSYSKQIEEQEFFRAALLRHLPFIYATNVDWIKDPWVHGGAESLPYGDPPLSKEEFIPYVQVMVRGYWERAKKTGRGRTQ